MNNKCPVCDTPYREGQALCQTCNWDLSLYAQSSSGNIINRVGAALNEKVPKSVEIWARKIWQQRNRYRQERNQSKQEAQRWREDVVVELQKKVENLTRQLQQSSNLENEIPQLKQELYSDLDNRIYSIVQQSLTNFDFGEKFWKLEQSILSRLQSQHEASPTSSQSDSQASIMAEKDKDFSDQSQEIIAQQNHLTTGISLEEQSLIDTYYNNPEYLNEYVSKVALTKQTLEDIYLHKAVDIVFQISNQSDYWIVKLKSGTSYLLPDLTLKINTNIKSIRMIFDLENYTENESKKFTIIKPAKVYAANNKQWKLIEKGILEF